MGAGHRGLVTAALLCVAACAAPASTPTPTPTPTADSARRAEDVRASIRADIEAEIAAGRLTGVAVALVHRGRIVWEEGFGWADREAGRRATSHTPFSLASTTKPITTTAMMTLVRAGTLDLDRPANAYLGPDRIVDDRGPAREVTLRRLASHSSGLPTFFAMYPEGSAARQPPVAALIRDYGHLVAPVGERYEYSNLAFAILAEVVARASGQEFGRALQARVLSPLGMEDSFFDTDLSRRREMAARYGDAGNRLPFYLTATPGSGEVFASAHDMARFAMFHLGDDLGPRAAILTAAERAELHRPHTRVTEREAYALGWQVLRGPGEAAALYHGGGQSGVSTEFLLVPSADAAVVVLSNRRGRPFLESIRDRLLRSVVPGWRGLPAPPSPAPQPLQPAASYTGTWRGTLLAQGRPVPAVLVITGSGQGTLSVGGRPPQPITDLGLVDGRISGDTRGEIGSLDTRRESLTQLSLDLALRPGRIDGDVVAWRKTSDGMTVLPHRAVLERAPRAHP
ncbi:MAG TPA: serine hydrolase domain-containing protein [Kofleriaceae bacterium]|nr:serine hydrolase domain-containing protein [Kofleriaceae bacterium]